jgi:hypothetical protein
MLLSSSLAQRDIPLNWDVFVTPGIPTVTSDLPPGTKQQMWSPISSTLIYGKRDAVLRDFDRLAETTTTARELYDKMLELYPDRVNPGLALWLSARAVKG